MISNFFKACSSKLKTNLKTKNKFLDIVNKHAPWERNL